MHERGILPRITPRCCGAAAAAADPLPNAQSGIPKSSSGGTIAEGVPKSASGGELRAVGALAGRAATLPPSTASWPRAVAQVPLRAFSACLRAHRIVFTFVAGLS